MYVKFVDLQFICCLISRTSPVLLNVYVVLPSSTWGQVRHPCLELQRKVPCGWFLNFVLAILIYFLHFSALYIVMYLISLYLHVVKH